MTRMGSHVSQFVARMVVWKMMICATVWTLGILSMYQRVFPVDAQEALLSSHLMS